LFETGCDRSVRGEFQFRKKRASINPQPTRGTKNPARKDPAFVEETPTIQGSKPPPMLERTNITDPMRAD